MRWSDRQLAMLREIGVVLPQWDTADAGAVVVDARPPARPEPATGFEPTTLHEPVASIEPMVREPVAPVPAPMSRADWLVVADIGSDDEAQLLANMLHAAGMSEAAADPARRAARIDPRGADLDAAIASAAPRVILALGRIAAQSLVGGDEPLGRLRGRVHMRGGIPLVVTWPPSYLLRHAEEKAKAWADLCLAANTVDATR